MENNSFADRNFVNVCDTDIETKKKFYQQFSQLIENQFMHGGKKYQLKDNKEFTDAICECFGGDSGVDWALGTIMKYLGRYKNFGREKDLLKIATYTYILWLKGGFHLNDSSDEDIFENMGTTINKVIFEEGKASNK